MPSTQENQTLYQQRYDWAQAGEEWSWPWGGSDMQWYGTWLPRVQRFLPTSTVLEIGAGYGRWSAFLKAYCDRLLLVDLAERCAEACRARFAGDVHVESFVNDGQSLTFAADNSVDFACSFDSLVHVDNAVLGAYIQALTRKLSGNGVAFLHHSNLGSYRANAELAAELDNEPMLHDRDPSVSAAQVRTLVEQAGLVCCGQELVNWGTRRALIDCFTTIAMPHSPWVQPYRQLSNRDFMTEVIHLGRLAELYGAAQKAADPVRL